MLSSHVFRLRLTTFAGMCDPAAQILKLTEKLEHATIIANDVQIQEFVTDANGMEEEVLGNRREIFFILNRSAFTP